MVEKIVRTLNPQQEMFCKLYASDEEFFANGVKSYAEAYDFNLGVKGNYRVANSAASRLLTNVNILAKINENLKMGGLNETFVDKQLNFLITQNADLSTKKAAITEFNKLNGRITEKRENKNYNSKELSKEDLDGMEPEAAIDEIDKQLEQLEDNTN